MERLNFTRTRQVIIHTIDMQGMFMKALIIIPAYNEELTIGSVVILSKKYGDVLVVDDGSHDRTSQAFLCEFKEFINHGV